MSKNKYSIFSTIETGTKYNVSTEEYMQAPPIPNSHSLKGSGRLDTFSSHSDNLRQATSTGSAGDTPSTSHSKGTPRQKSSRKRPAMPPARISSNPKHIFNLPPLKIIKASTSYKGHGGGELDFQKGDFFYVIHDKPDLQMYEVMNPIEKTRGTVHYRYFSNVARNAHEEKEQQEQLSRELAAGSGSGNPAGQRNVDEYMDGLPSPTGPHSAPWDTTTSRNMTSPLAERKGWSDDETDYDPKRPSRYDAIDDYYNDSTANADDDSYFQQQQQQPIARALPPTPPRNMKSHLDPNGLESCLVQSCSLSNEKWYFVIHAKYNSGKLDIIRRSYDDIWALQVTLLSRFPEHSGHRGMPRLIPFLTPPQPGLSREETKVEMNRYFKELDTLPPSILASPHYTKFFTVKIGDLGDTSINSDVADTLMDLLDDIVQPPPPELVIKLVLGQEIIAWREDQGTISYDDLMFEAEDRLGFGCERLLYSDETNDMVPLYGDDDLRLLISSSPKLKFFVE